MSEAGVTGSPVSIVSTGLVALDIVLTPESDKPLYFAGGTCGNVSTILSFIGWQSTPLARFADDQVASRIAKDMASFDVDVGYLRLAPRTRPPIIVQRIKRDAQKRAFHTFSSRCPTCGGRLPGYRAVTRVAIEEALSELEVPTVAFLDRPSSGALLMAEQLADKGALVVFEPAAIGPPHLFRRALKLAHIVKYSAETAPRFPAQIDELPKEDRPLLEIETDGAKGLRFRSRLRTPGRAWTWKQLDALPVPLLRDAAGAGDWCTAGIIARLAKDGLQGLESTSSAQLGSALRIAQGFSAINCSYEGARGAMYAMSSRSVIQKAEQLAAGKSNRSQRRPRQRRGTPPRGEAFCCSVAG